MSRTPDKFINPNFTNNTSDGTKDSSASYSREALEEILKTYQLDVASNLSNGLVLDIERDTARQTAIQALTDLCTKRETLARIDELERFDPKLMLDYTTERIQELKRGKT